MFPMRDANNDKYRGDQYQQPASFQPREQEDLSRAPIGVFDSGAGGLTILSALRQELPDEDYLYIGDTAHCPYGTRSEAEIIELSIQACRFLVEQGVKLIVVACNTASQAALHTLRATFSLPFVGVVPAVKPAANITKHGRIGIAATNQAAKATYLKQLINDFAHGIEVYAVGCPDLVMLVERGEMDGPVVEATLQRDLQPLLANDVDVIVLGCTHFPALRSAIERVAGSHVLIIDSGGAVARRTHSLLDSEGMLHVTKAHAGNLQIWCSGNAQHFSSVASTILCYPVIACQTPL